MDNKVQNRQKPFSRDIMCRICLCILLISLVVKLIYAYKVSYHVSPHDLGEISSGEEIQYGHLAYIQYLYENKQFLPVKPFGQFYHPPLFPMIGAIVLALFSNHGTNLPFAFEILQYVNVFFSFLVTVYAYLLLDKAGIKNGVKVMLTALLAFTPSLTIIGTALNNDCLMALFGVMALYYTICWFQDEKLSSIIKIALCIGLAMLSKTSGGLVAVPIGITFLYKLISCAKKQRKSIIIQFFVFGIICVPLGLSWVLRNKILFDMPFSYVVDLGENSIQYLGNCTLLQRIGIPSYRQIIGYKIFWNMPEQYTNIWGQTFLTMNFDEGILNISNNYFSKGLAVLLLWISVFLYFLMFVRMLKAIFMKSIPVVYKLIGVGAYVIFTASYISFCFKYPQICTMNFRYILLTWFSLVLFDGLYLKEKEALMKTRVGKLIYNIEVLMVAMYCILSVFLYITYAV